MAVNSSCGRSPFSPFPFSPQIFSSFSPVIVSTCSGPPPPPLLPCLNGTASRLFPGLMMLYYGKLVLRRGYLGV